jgi:hypothetical protein
VNDICTEYQAARKLRPKLERQKRIYLDVADEVYIKEPEGGLEKYLEKTDSELEPEENLENLDDFVLDDGDLVNLNPKIVSIAKQINEGGFWNMQALVDKFREADRE